MMDSWEGTNRSVLGFESVKICFLFSASRHARGTWRGRLSVVCFCGVLSLGTPLFAQDQPPRTDPLGRFGQPPPITLEEVTPSPPAPTILPPIPPQAPDKKILPSIKIFVKEIRVVGSTVFTPEELAAVVSPYVNRELSTEDFEELRRALTELYVGKGYVTSGAFLPDQTIKDGIVIFQILEGVLSDIRIEGTHWFWPWYFTSRLHLSAGTPVNLNNVRDRLQLFLQDERLARINAELQPGVRTGASVLQVQVEERNPWRLWGETNNYQSPSIGETRGLVTAANMNLLGLGDWVSVTYGQSEGLDPLIDTTYSLPFTPWDTTLSFQYRKNDFTVVESPFDDLDIKNKNEIFTFTLRQPVYRTSSQELALIVIGEHSKNKSFLLGIPFSFLPGTTSDGEFEISVLRLAQEYTYRKPNQVLAAYSRFSVGLDVLDATINSSSNVPDGQFFSWLGQVQGAHRFEAWGIQTLVRLDLQVANDRLFPLEQYSMGGRFTVRGYRENTLVRDNAFLFSTETRIPLFPKILGGEFLQLAPFVDVGRSWLSKDTTPDPQTLASIGIGLRFTYGVQGHALFKNISGSIYWGQQLNHVTNPGNGLQNNGVHFQVVVQAF